MTVWNKEISLYVDADVAEGGAPLLDGKNSSARSALVYFMQGDKLTLNVYFRRRSTSTLTASSAIELPAGYNIVVAAKLAAGMEAATLLFSALDFAAAGAGDDLCYTATLDLNTHEIDAAFAASDATFLAIKVDIEVQDAGNTARATFQFDATLKQQAYDGEASPTPGTPSYPLPADIVTKSIDGSFDRFVDDGVNPKGWYKYNPDDGLWYMPSMKTVDGVPVLAPGVGVAL